MRRGESVVSSGPATVTASAGATAIVLSEVMADVLEVDEVALDSDFFDDLGADSMMMAHFCARLRKLDDLPSIAIKQVYRHPSIGALAASIDGRDVNEGQHSSDGATTATLPEQPPRTVTPAVPVSRAMYWLCGLLQLATAGGLILLGAFVSTIGYDWVAASTDVVGLYGRSAVLAGAVFVGLSIVPILLKWVLVGRWKPGRFRLWGFRYFRFWLVRVLLRVNPLALFAGSPIYNIYLRALGARVGRGAVVQARPVPVCADLLSVGDNAVIRKDSLMNGYRANAGWIELGPVTIGADAVIGELTVLDIDTSVGDGAQLGHQSALDAGQSVPAGERWVGVSAHERVEVATAAVEPVGGSARRRFLYPIFQLAILFGLTLPIATSIAMTLAEWQISDAALLENHTVQWDSALFYEEVLAFSLVLFAALILFRLVLATVVPRLFRRAIRPGAVYPLFGWRYGAHRLIQRFTNARFFPRLLGDSSYIVHYLHLLGYDVSFEAQTGSNFSQTIKQDNPYAVSVGAGTMVADVISLINADYSSTSFRVSELSIGANSFYGNSIAYPADAKTGDDCLHASKVVVPVDGEVRAGVGFLGSPSFEIPRTVFRDAEFAEPKDDQGRPERLGAKNRHNLVTIGWFLLTRLLGIAGAVFLLLTAADVYPRFGVFAFAASSFTGLVAGTLYLILVERASVGFKRLVPLSCSLYDRRMWRHERFWKLSSQPRVFNGTPFKSILWRLYGVTMGKRVFDDGCTIIEKTMSVVGDHCTLNAGSVIQPHSQEDGAIKSDYISLGSGCTLGLNALVHYGVTMHDGSTLSTNAFLMKGNDVPAGTYWGENPAREIDTVVTVDGADDRQRTDPVTATADHLDTSRPYWRDLLLAGGPTAVPRWSSGAEDGVGTVSSPLDDLAAELRSEADAKSISIDALLVAAHAKVLATMSGDTEILTGLVPAEGGQATPFRLSTEPSTWQALAERAEEASQEHATHHAFPVDALRDELHLAGPPFEAVLDLSGPAGDLDDGTVWRVSLVRDADSMTLICDHRLEAVDADAATRVLDYHRNALASMIADPSREHAEQGMLTDDELTFQLEGLAGPERELPDRRFHELFEDAVTEHPDAIAAVHRDEEWTYRELNARANRIGRSLLARGVERETVVAVVTERNLDWMASVLAIFKAGGVYLPIEPHFPAERIARTLGRAACTLVVTEYGSGDNLFDALGSLDGVDTMFVNGAYRETDERDLGIEVGEDQLAYIYFTSGSTGEPKGAMCEHAGMINHLYAKIDDFEIGPGAVVAQIAPQCFDISLWQLVSALLVGGRTLIVEQDILLDPERFLDRIVGGEVAVAQVVPSYLEVLLSYLDHHPLELNDLHCVSVTGEALSLELTHRWFASQPGIKLANAYGLTETSDDTNHEVMDRPPAGDRVPLGPAVNNVSVRVVDPVNLQLVPLGAPGEIVFAGVCVGRGYINDPERTAQAFLDDPLQSGQRLYRSGDFGFWRPDGKLEFLGRRDAQVKIRGFRIEIGSIENHMLTVPGVHQAAVVVLERPDGAKQLVGFVAGESIGVDTVRERLEEALPEYMVPPALHLHDGLPTTDNGKIDRKSLRAQAADLDVATDVEPPTTPAERRLVSAWAGVLGVAGDQIGRRDDFFDRGSSLTAVELVIALDGAITLKDIAGSPVLADLALLLDREDSGPTGLLQLLSTPADEPAPTLVCFPYAGGNAINYRAMAAELGASGVAVHAVELPGHDLADGSDDLAPIDEIVGRIADEVAELDLSALLLWGHSSGAAFAIETARRLESRGTRVDRLFVAAQLPLDVATRRAHLAELAEQSDDDVATVLAADGGYTELHEFANGRTRHIGAAYRHDCTSAHQVLIDALEGPPLAKLAAPVTVVAAADDPSTAEAAARFAEWDLITDHVELHELSDGGHYFLRTRPAESAAAVLAAVETPAPDGQSAALPTAGLNGRSSNRTIPASRSSSSTSSTPLDVVVEPGHALVTAAGGAGQGSAWLAEHRDDVRGLVADHGAVVVRGLDLGDPAAVAEAVGAVAGRTMDDLEAFASRERYDGGVFSSSAWPTNQQMCMHHELSYRLESPGLMMFSCLTAPTEGGSIGVADASNVLEALPTDVVERFDREGWMLVRNYNGDIGSTVAEAFGTEDRGEVERYCRDNDITTEWLEDGTLRTRQRRQAVLTHPMTGRRCWFNQVAFLSGWTMQPEVRDFLVEMYGPDGLPFDTRHGNGDPIAEDVVRRINEVYEANTAQLELSAGDVVLVDNLRTAHGREPYEGDRQVVVAMADPVRIDELGRTNGAATRPTSASTPARTGTPARTPTRATPTPTRAASRTPVTRATARRQPTTEAVNEEVRTMTNPAVTIVPVTVRASRALAHRPSEILAAYGDIRRRVRWQADPEEILVLESHDFRIGGTDHFVYRSRHYPGLIGTVRYERIEDEVLVYTRTLADEDGRTMAISVVSWSLQPCSAGTEITIAEHTTSLDGSAPIEGSEYRLQTLLDRLSFELTNLG